MLCWMRLKLTIKTPEQRQWRCSGVLIVNFERIHQNIQQTNLIRFSAAGFLTNKNLFQLDNKDTKGVSGLVG